MVGFTDHPDPEGETPDQKIARGKQIWRDMVNDDPGIGNLGLNIRMGDETLSVAQKKKSAYIDENNYVVFTDHPDPIGETPEEKRMRGIQILRARRDDDPNGNLGLNIHMDGESLSVA